MKQEIILDKPRSIRFTKEQEQVFDELEKSGINISFLIRKVADVVIKEQQTNNQPKQAISGFDQEFVKQAVSGDTVEIREIHGRKQNTELSAKWVMIMNNLPRIDDFN